MRYVAQSPYQRRRRSKRPVIKIFWLFLAIVIGVVFFRVVFPSKQKQAENHLKFDQSVTMAEQKQITEAIAAQNKALTHNLKVSIKNETKVGSVNNVLSAYVPVTGLYSPRQNVGSNELSTLGVAISNDIDGQIADSIAQTIAKTSAKKVSPSVAVDSDDIVLITTDNINPKVKVLSLDGNYYLDNFTSGGIFRVAQLSGEGTKDIAGVSFNKLPTKDTLFKVNMTGVTALTRLMMQKLNSVGDPLYFSKYIGPFLKDADLTHVSNEVSFKENCQFSHAVFCSDPRFIKTLQDSGVDLVELTGNHNNDVGDQFNTNTINKYKELGIATFGGGLNTDDAKKPYFADTKGSRIAFLGYNYPDSPSGFAIAGSDSPGANSFDYEKIKSDISGAKQQSQFVIVNVQFAECYAYPDGYVEFPQCNNPISGQKEAFRKIIDLGADMVVGSAAHQPQLYELYNNKPIYYGLGNLYFDQVQWPGTERSIILTNYFKGGKLLQTKLTPTVYDDALQTRKMTDSQATKFLQFLNSSR